MTDRRASPSQREVSLGCQSPGKENLPLIIAVCKKEVIRYIRRQAVSHLLHLAQLIGEGDQQLAVAFSLEKGKMRKRLQRLASIYHGLPRWCNDTLPHRQQ